MSKAFNFTDNNYLDSTGVVHHRIPLNVVLDNIGDITNTYSASQTDAYSCNYINEKLYEISTNTKSKMTIGLSANVSHKATTKVALNTIMDSVGDKFTLSANGIKIGAGVTKVKVSANILQHSTAVNLYGGYITKNGTNLASAVNVGFNTITNTNSWAFFHTGISPIIIDVTEGDILYLCSYVGATSTVTLQAYAGRAVNLTVEEV